MNEMSEFREFLSWCVAPANFVYTLLLLLIFLYWLSVIFGALDLGFGTPDMDGPDLDANLDADAGVDAGDGPEPQGLPADVGLGHPHEKGVPSEGAPAWLLALKYLNIGEVPLMLYLSAFIPFAWALSMTATHWTGWAGWTGLLAFGAPVVAAAALLAKAATLPLKALFRALNRPAHLVNPEEMVGRECVVTSLAADEWHGQAEVAARGAPLALNVLARAGASLPKGTRGVVVELLDEERGIYLIEPV